MCSSGGGLIPVGILAGRGFGMNRVIKRFLFGSNYREIPQASRAGGLANLAGRDQDCERDLLLAIEALGKASDA